MAQRQHQQATADGARRPQVGAIVSAIDLRIHCALNLGRPLSAVRVEARLGHACQISASVSADAGVACFNAWGRLPMAEDAECLHLKVRRVRQEGAS
jgi:hypothetical protein